MPPDTLTEVIEAVAAPRHSSPRDCTLERHFHRINGTFYPMAATQRHFESVPCISHCEVDQSIASAAGHDLHRSPAATSAAVFGNVADDFGDSFEKRGRIPLTAPIGTHGVTHTFGQIVAAISIKTLQLIQAMPCVPLVHSR
ncbi:hypothetical protein [Mycobacteroides abscessus]|uniref:hypothetical protein n=1 Tax=Mycobacteroides abscessus TaxID=36809 RepID=UPI002670B8BE|nr:hypothetical protein [Mycobacteroides abscessus]MDO3110299.1 hypothetical protein [Mycobacteroides abscessus subsp. abscessus]